MQTFFDSIRNSLFKKLTTDQVKGMEAIIVYWRTLDIHDDRKLAYILATAYHETAATMQPIEEFGKGKGKDYGKRLKMSRRPYTDTENLFYGRGLVQLTWYENYQKAGKLLGKDLIKNPELMLDMNNSVIVLVQGMITGFFTGKKLSHYFTARMTAPKLARRIINGNDKSDLIAQHYAKFLIALNTL